MTIVDELVANPGLYVGVDRVVGTDLVGSARMMVTALPGRTGVALDYEVFNPASPGPLRGHVEHTLVARAHDGDTIMVIADTHSGGLVVLHETESGVFEAPPEDSPYPMKVVIAVPEAGRLDHHWWYGAPGEEAVPRDLAELTLTT
jgi:hypothetical protein